VVEREGVSVRHPARFVLVGSGNPEEGELRPQLLDRFGLAVDVRTPSAIATRIEVIKRRDAFDRAPETFLAHWSKSDAKIRRALEKARKSLETLVVPDAVLERSAALCSMLGTDGLRGELTLLRTSRAFAAYEHDATVTLDHLRRIAPMALRHRLRRNVLDDAGSTTRVERAVAELWGDAPAAA
jgi:magnesium chelatase subunit I